MKNTGKKTMKASITAGLLLLISAVFLSSNKTSAVSARVLDCGNVTNQQVINFLTPLGYTVYSVNPIPGSCDKRCDTQHCFDTKVLILNGIIVDYEDMPNGCRD
jgi:hypothetical protein